MLASAIVLEAGSAAQEVAAPAFRTEVCDVTPRSIAELLELAEAGDGSGTVVAPLPVGKRADIATTAAIGTVVRELAACLSNGDLLRYYALSSDHWLRETLSGDRARIEELAAKTQTPVSKEQHVEFIGPWHTEILPDGRVLAAILIRSPDEAQPDPRRTQVLIFKQHDGNWLIDERIETVRVSGCDVPVDVATAVGPPPGELSAIWPVSCA